MFLLLYYLQRYEIYNIASSLTAPFLIYLSIISNIIITPIKKGLLNLGFSRRSAQKKVIIHSSTFALLILAICLITSFSVGATTYISQSYATTDKIALGSIVSLQKNTTDHVVAASSSNSDSLFGVVINSDNSVLSLNSGGENQVQIATSGTLQVLVSNINGEILRGDQITASPIAGVGMKATSNARVIGTAQGDLINGSKQTYKDQNNVDQSVVIGEVPILVNVSYYYKQPDKTLIPSAIQNVANSLAGKPVDTLPIIVSAAIFIIMIVVVVSIIFAMVNSSIISVGRNPMSQSAIYRDLIQLSALVLAILTVGLISIYLVLTRM